jgi:hypothetical protein
MLRRGHHVRCFPGKATERYLIRILKEMPLLVMILGFAIIVPALSARESVRSQARPFPTAEEVSRQWLTRHPRPRDEAEQRIIAVMDVFTACEGSGDRT